MMDSLVDNNFIDDNYTKNYGFILLVTYNKEYITFNRDTFIVYHVYDLIVTVTDDRGATKVFK